MKIFTKSEINFLENCAVEAGVPLYDLMEKAGAAVAVFVKKQTEVQNKNIVILCGKGNNGGDGFVCARRLSKLNSNVSIILTQGEAKTDIAKEAFSKLENDVNIIDFSTNKFESENAIEKADIIIDAIFGIGFKSGMDSMTERVISYSNKSKALKFAVDIPSGAECDTGKIADCCFMADFTVAFTAIKPANVIYPAAGYCGKNVVAPVGIDKKYIDSLPGTFSVIKEADVNSLFKRRNPSSHKGTFGTLLMICGSYSMLGAAIMAGRAALRSGVGLLNMVVSKECYPIIAGNIPEAIFTVVDFSDDETTKHSCELLYSAINKADACVVGCGLGDESERYVPIIMKFATCPVVLDADALKVFAKNPLEYSDRRCEVVVTPHPGEMAKMMGKTVLQIQIDRMILSKRFAKEFKVYTVLKGSGTIISSPTGETRLNTTGNPGMAKGGSGDVLAGMIGSLLAQGLKPLAACTAGVYIHGKAGDICSEMLSQTSMLPTDLIKYIPKVFSKIESNFK